jgi:NAD(P)-dependent dehydrogenase (short-subunit alcohol dehydrogenase family)
LRALGGRTAVVTGAASGLGRGLCLALAAEGVRIVAADLEMEPLAETVRLVHEQGGWAAGHVTDVTVPTADTFAEHCAIANQTRLRKAPPQFQMF